MSSLENFEKMLANGQDNPLLRFSLGNEYLKGGLCAGLHAPGGGRAAKTG